MSKFSQGKNDFAQKMSAAADVKSAAGDVQKFLEAIWQPGEVRELRIFNQAKEVVCYGYFDRGGAAARAVEKVAPDHVVYVTLNACNPALLARAENRLKRAGRKSPTTSDKDILQNTLLLVDIDPARPADISSSEDELKAARECAKKIKDFLGEPLVAGMSGNGYHLIYRHDPATPGQRKEFLQDLQAKFGNAIVHVDAGNFNPARITKVLGTWARKGDNTKDRPHRQSKVISISQNPVVLSLPPEAPVAHTTKVATATTQAKTAGSKLDVATWCDAHGIKIKEIKTWQDKTMHVLQECIFDSAHKGGEASILQDAVGKITYQCFHNSCKARTWPEARALVEGGAPQAAKAPPACNKCGAEIAFEQMPSGKFKPVNVDGSKHICRKKVQKSAEDARNDLKTAQNEAKNDLPVIKILGGQLPSMVDQAEAALIKSDVQIFQRNGILCRIVTAKPEKTVRRGDGAVIISSVDLAYLVETFTKVANWEKFDKREGEWQEVNCPKIVAETYMARKIWNVPVLTGVIESPTMRADGTIISAADYDQDTGLFYQKRFQMSEIVENPNLEDAKKAVAVFRDLLCDFTFASDSDFSVALAAILTAQTRHLYSTAPIFGITAPVMESGKSLLANIPAMIATGHNAAMLNQARSQEEENKRLLSVLLAGDNVVCIDNIEYPLNSADLCTIISEPIWSGGRVLGTNHNPKVSTQVTFIATGNNLTFSSDLTTRAVICSLSQDCEKPGDREFKRNLYKYIPENRNALVAASLTILRAYFIAGRPCQRFKPWARFEDWSNLVRAALVWCGLPDPCQTREKIEANDPVRETLQAFLTCWKNAFDDRPTTINEAIDIANQDTAFLEILKEISGGKEGIDPAKIGRYVKRYANRIQGGMYISENGKTRTNKIMWSVFGNVQKDKPLENVKSSWIQGELIN